MKTTAKHFSIFKTECLKWIEIFGLKDWTIEFRHYEHKPGRASVWANTVNRLAAIYLSPKWNSKVTKKRLNLAAFHEVCEVLMTPLVVNAKSRFISSDEIEETTHYVIRTLENVLFPRY